MNNKKKQRTFSKIHPTHKKRLRELAKEHGQAWVAERLGITASGVSRILQPGAIGVFPSTLEAIVELVGKNGVEATGGHPRHPQVPWDPSRLGRPRPLMTRASLRPNPKNPRVTLSTNELKCFDDGTFGMPHRMRRLDLFAVTSEIVRQLAALAPDARQRVMNAVVALLKGEQ